jgi:hypothetical protein
MTDQTTRLSNWFQIISNVAIIVGLGLVIYELNQSKQIAHVGNMDEMFSRITNRHLALVGEDPRTTLARAALRPSDLTEEDAVALEEIYTDVTLSWANSLRAESISGVNRNSPILIANDTRRYFTTEPGRRWLEAWASRMRDVPVARDAAAIAEEAARGAGQNYYKETYELLLAEYGGSRSLAQQPSINRGSR